MKILIYVFDWLIFIQCVISFSSIQHTLLFVITSFSSNIDQVHCWCTFLSILDVHHKDWLTYSGGTNTPCELCYNFYTQMTFQNSKFLSLIPDCDSHSPALLDLFLSFKPNFCSTMAFPLLVNFDHVVVSVSIDFCVNSKGDAPLILLMLIGMISSVI